MWYITTVVQRSSKRRHSSDSEMHQAEAEEFTTELSSADGSFIKAKAHAFGQRSWTLHC